MFANLTGWHFLILLAIVLLVFGATKLPALARSTGQSIKIFRNEMKKDDEPTAESVVAEPGDSTTTPTK